MRLLLRMSLWALVGWSVSVTPALAVTIVYTEHFNTSNENWKNSLSNLSQDATWINGGGPGGVADAFIKSSFTTPPTGTPSSSQVMFRARDTVNSSSNIFFGNWIGGDVSVDFWFRHDASTALNIGMRVPTAAGFPAMLGRFPVAVLPNTWTHLTMAINATNPDLLDETGPTHLNYNAVFGTVKSIQIFANLATQGNSTLINFDLDQFRLVPEPSTWLMAGVGLPALVLAFRARRRRLAA